jgi:hypothetical protein
MIWILGEYADRIDNAHDLLEQLTANFEEDSVHVRALARIHRERERGTCARWCSSPHVAVTHPTAGADRRPALSLALRCRFCWRGSLAARAFPVLCKCCAPPRAYACCVCCVCPRPFPLQVQLQLLTAAVKLFLKKPATGQTLVQRVLQLATTGSDNPDLRDRGYIYWRLLSSDPATAKAVVLAEKPPIANSSETLSGSVLDELIANLGTLASVYHKPAASFLSTGKVAPLSVKQLQKQAYVATWCSSSVGCGWGVTMTRVCAALGRTSERMGRSATAAPTAPRRHVRPLPTVAAARALHTRTFTHTYIH